jgi:hypothetical protein
MKFQNKHINTENHHLLGTIWPFRGCQVEMRIDGFSCNCKKRHLVKCYHVKSVELGILGVNAKEYRLEPVHS